MTTEQTAPASVDLPNPRAEDEAPIHGVEARDTFEERVSALDVGDRKTAGRLRAMKLSRIDGTEAERQEERDLMKSLTGLTARDFDKLCPTMAKRETPVGQEIEEEEAPPPNYPLSMSDTGWAFSLGDGADSYERGVYRRASGEWQHKADLPYCHARIVRRDGGGTRRATDYLLSATEGGDRVVLSRDAIRDGSGAGPLGLSLATDRKVIDAWGTAIDAMAFLPDVPEREAVPRLTDSDEITVPVPECLPAGYLRTSALAREDALTIWRERIVSEISQSPAAATMYGASAGGPFLDAVGAHSHIVDAFGDSDAGKTTTVRGCASIWGDSRGQAGTFRSWNATGKGPLRYLGQLGLFPAFMDERGMAPFEPADWGTLIYCLTSGLQRMAATSRDQFGLNVGLPWSGLLVTSGNGRLLYRIENGKWDGCPKRVIEVVGQLTTSAPQAEQIARDTSATFGHLGAALLERFSAADARKLYASVWEAEISPGVPLLPLPAGGNPRTWAKELAVHVMGAWMVDIVLGTGTMLRDAAATFGRQYIADRSGERRHDADVLLDAILGAMAAESAKWPTKSEYKAMRSVQDFSPQGFTNSSKEVRRHGVDRSLSGVIDDEGKWVVVFPKVLHAIADELEVDESRAFRKLYDSNPRGMLVAASARKRGEWTTLVKLDEGKGGRVPVYKFVLPEVPEEPEEDQEKGTEDGNGGGGPEGPQDPTPAPVDPDQVTARDSDGNPVRGTSELCIRECGKLTPYRSVSGKPLHIDAYCTPASAPTPATLQAISARVKPDPTPKDLTADSRDRGSRPAESAPVKQTPKQARSIAQRVEDAMKQAGGDQAEAIKALRNTAIDDAWEILEVLRARGRYDTIKFPELPDIMEKRSKNDADQIWEGRPNWTNAAVPNGTRVNRLDMNAAYLNAMNTDLPKGALVHSDSGEFDRKRSGAYLITPPEWTHTDLPNPLGNRDTPGQLWVMRPTLQLLTDLSEEKYGNLCAAPVIHESWTSGSTSTLLRGFKDLLNGVRMAAIEADDKVTLAYIKAMYSKFTATMGESTYNRNLKRSDWVHTIRAQAFTSLWRRARKAQQADLTVYRVSGTDELHVVGDWRAGLAEGPALGQIKLKTDDGTDGTYVVGEKRAKSTDKAGE